MASIQGQIPFAEAIGPGETLDSVFRGEVRLIQRRQGYRFSVDALLLAAFAGKPKGGVVDLGTGCGVISLLLARRGIRSIIAVELQAGLFELASRNVQLNNFADNVHVLNADLRQLRGVLPAGAFDLVLSNPPYIAKGTGNVNPVAEKALARHELACSLPEVASAAKYLLRDGGAFKLIFPSSRLAELLATLTRTGLAAKRMRLIHPFPDRPAKLVLLEAIKGAGDVLEALPPLVLFDASGDYSAEAQRILSDAQATLDARPRD